MTTSDVADFTALNAVLLDLHRAGRKVALSAFQRIALELIAEVIPFDSAWWGNASAEPPEIHWLHLYNCDGSILDAYTPHMGEDFMRAALIANPGKSINLADLMPRARFVRTPLYRNVGKLYKIEWALGTLLVEPVSSLQEFLTLWRHDPKKPFTEAERRMKEWLMPHLADAHRHARLRALMGDPAVRRDCWAVADERGYLREVHPAFVHCLRARWPGWQGSRLPEELLANVREAQPMRWDNRKLTVTRSGVFRLLEIETLKRTTREVLSPREREIAQHYARGETHVGIAKALAISPATVRNHLAKSYRKLGVANKVELAKILA